MCIEEKGHKTKKECWYCKLYPRKVYFVVKTSSTLSNILQNEIRGFYLEKTELFFFGFRTLAQLVPGGFLSHPSGSSAEQKGKSYFDWLLHL